MVSGAAEELGRLTENTFDEVRWAPGTAPSLASRRLVSRAARAVGVAALGLACLAAVPYVRGSGRSAHGFRNADLESKVEQACHTAEAGEMCHDKVTWAMVSGIKKEPANYKGLTEDSTFEEFQAYFHRSEYGDCPMPCEGATRIPKAATTASSALAGKKTTQCLCLFDVDRTLTGKQGFAGQCPGTRAFPGVPDSAFGGGALTLSALGQAIGATFCGSCLVGVVSAGGASGPAMKEVLQGKLKGLQAVPTWWSGPGVVTSPLVIGCGNDLKAKCASGIIAWYEMHRNVDIPPEEVYFFDDLGSNVAEFAALGYNAHQVSCGSREGPVGLCGAVPSEILKNKGTSTCR